MPARFTLYSREYCHLCHEMVDALVSAQKIRHFEFNVVDVDTDPELEARLGARVPLLMEGDREIFHYYFDETLLDAALQARGQDHPAKIA